jgi:hypothetical protein
LRSLQWSEKAQFLLWSVLGTRPFVAVVMAWGEFPKWVGKNGHNEWIVSSTPPLCNGFHTDLHNVHVDSHVAHVDLHNDHVDFAAWSCG